MQTEHLKADAHGIERAAELLRGGACVAFATETVYGLGGDATNGQAVAGIYAAKGRPSFNPLIAHVPDLDAARALVAFTPEAEALAEAFWPGAVTLVLPLRADAGLSELVTAGLDTLAVRIPARLSAQALLRAVGRPVAAPSANPSGRISSVTAAQVLAGLTGKIAAVLDDGPCTVGLESTIVGFDPTPTILRPGGVSQGDLEAVLGKKITQRSEAGTISAPGQLASHYAPDASVRLNAQAAQGDEILIGFGQVTGEMTLSTKGDLTEAAAALFSALHAADATGRPIAVAPVPETGLGVAINDRLRRAAAPRDA